MNDKNKDKNKDKKKPIPFIDKLQKKRQENKVRATMQQAIPYDNVYLNGIIKTEEERFSKCYSLEDINFRIATQEDQEIKFQDYEKLLNFFGENADVQICINNKSARKEDVLGDVLIKPRNDDLNLYRDEYNQILKDKMTEGRNDILSSIYLSVSIPAETVEQASASFNRMETEIGKLVKRVTEQDMHIQAIEERLAIMHDIFNLFADNSVLPPESIHLEEEAKKGRTSKDIIGPSGFKFEDDYFKMGDTYGRSLFLETIPTFLSTDYLQSIVEIPANMLVSIHYNPLDQEKAAKLVRRQLTNINANIVEAQQRAAKGRYSYDLLPPELKSAKDSAEELMSDVTKRDQKMFFTTLVVTHFAATKEKLDEDTKLITSTSNNALCSMKKLFFQQETGLRASLPLASNKLCVDKLLTTECASVFIPFSVVEINQKNGIYYGLNAVSKTLLMYDRTKGTNSNGLILGVPGSGKSFTAKKEIVCVALNTNDDIYIIDPESEYKPLISALGGEVIKLAVGKRVYVNPMDMDINYAKDSDGDSDPVTMKADFISSICETVVGKRRGLTSSERSIIDRCVRNLYQPYLKHIHEINLNRPEGAEEITCDRNAMPTLTDFYSLLLTQPEIEAQNLALALELYTTGSLDIFAHRTNVDTTNRFVVYDIREIGSSLKELGLLICLNDMWNRIINNFMKFGKRTWAYIDEFYLLLQSESSAVFLQSCWKRARKWMGVMTGITQNVEDLLNSPAARGIINNCNFILMLNQSPIDRMNLATLLKISEAQLSYITNSDPGQGLLYNGKTIVPFIDNFPHNTKLYELITTKPEDVAKRRSDETKAASA